MPGRRIRPGPRGLGPLRIMRGAKNVDVRRAPPRSPASKPVILLAPRRGEEAGEGAKKGPDSRCKKKKPQVAPGDSRSLYENARSWEQRRTRSKDARGGDGVEGSSAKVSVRGQHQLATPRRRSHRRPEGERGGEPGSRLASGGDRVRQRQPAILGMADDEQADASRIAEAGRCITPESASTAAHGRAKRGARRLLSRSRPAPPSEESVAAARRGIKRRD